MESGSKCPLGIGLGAAAAERQQNRPRREAEFKSFHRKPREEWLEKGGGGRMVCAEPADRPSG